MYQFSLEYFNALFLNCIQKSEKSSDLDTRLANIMKFASFAIYNNVSRGLFGEHKITFSFMLATAIMRNAGNISPAEWHLLLVGAGIVDESALPNCPDGVDHGLWVLLCTISARVPALGRLSLSVATDMGAWKLLVEAEEPWDVRVLPQPIGDALTDFQRLLVIKVDPPTQKRATFPGLLHFPHPPRGHS